MNNVEAFFAPPCCLEGDNGEYTFHNVPVEPPHCALVPCSVSLMHVAILSKDEQGNDENNNAPTRLPHESLKTVN
jgi:hypothetical protein